MRNCFWHSEQFLYTSWSPHVLQKEELLTKIYLQLVVGIGEQKKKIIKFDNEKALDLLSNKANCGKNWVISRRMTGIRILVSEKFTKVGESIWKCQIILLEIVIPPPFWWKRLWEKTFPHKIYKMVWKTTNIPIALAKK